MKELALFILDNFVKEHSNGFIRIKAKKQEDSMGFKNSNRNTPKQN
jgi:hypothetical protein